MASGLDYLPAIVPFTFVVVFIVGGVVLLLFQRVDSFCWGPCQCRRNVPIGNDSNRPLLQKFTHGYSFEYVYESGLKVFLGAEASLYLLFIFRVLAFGFFLGVPFIWNYVRRQQHNAYYFTLWNINLITTYYLFVVVASLIGVIYHKQFQQHQTNATKTAENKIEDATETEQRAGVAIPVSYWSDATLKFGYAVQIIFEITGSTAFFITVVNFLLLDPSMEFWNVSFHLITTLSLLIEISLNHLIVRPEHVIFTILWALVYLIFIWPQVASENVKHWPYFFLNAESPSVFAWYIGLIAGLMVFFYIFWFTTNLKYLFIAHLTNAKATITINAKNAQILPEKDVEKV